MPPDEKVVDDTKTEVDDKKVSTEEGKQASSEESKEIDEKPTKTDDEIDDDEVEAAEERIQTLLDKLGFDSLEELEESVGSLKELQELIGKRDANKLIEDSDYLAKVKEFWAEQDEVKKREGETSDETIERLEKELKEKDKKLKDRDKKDEQKKEEVRKAKEAQRLINSFNSTVSAEIDKVKDLPKEYRDFFEEYLGINNPANEVDLNLRPEIRKMAKDGIKKIFDFEQLVIKRYLDGKIEMPKITPTDTTTTPVSKEKQPKNLKEARSTLMEAFGITKKK